ncbi:TlpA disulfide reductase family protein [Flavimarina sp. Hel_I_48]|uniref:TlpA disulfide reductase family protein n=1 Tax=Flavimarina sp. Hel_I_48 TaxID=1392488 RepID=UPI0004DF13D7|nr:TlpA disulfide reductase family protein [Flavimarina sp. Hel_I_48]
MTNIIKAIAATLILTSCAQETNYKIDGSAEGIKDGTKVFLQEISNQNQLVNIDTSIVKSGKFSFDPAEVENPDLNLITVEGINGNIIFVSENETLKIKADKDSIVASNVKGGEENNFFKTYFDEVMGSNKERQRIQQEGMAAMREGDTSRVDAIRSEMQDINENSVTKRMKMIDNHTESNISVLILSDLLGSRLIDATKAEEKFNSLSEKVRNSEKGKKLGEMIAKAKASEIAATLPEIGNMAPKFSAPTPDGGELALSDAMGKYTIVDFWASWCKPCRLENPNVVNIYNKYHDLGLNIISVSLDKPDNKQAWTNAIAKDKMDWHHVSNLMFWNEPVAKKYGVSAIPATFLLDAEGKIIDKNLRGEDLEVKIASLLGQS